MYQDHSGFSGAETFHGSSPWPDPEGSTLSYGPGAEIFAKGQIAASIFYIQEGRVKVTASRRGKDCILGVFQAGQFFGQGNLDGSTLRAGTARTIEASLVTSISLVTMREAIWASAGLARLFMTQLLTRNCSIEADLADQLLRPTEMRLARRLLILANFQDGNESSNTPVNFNQQSLADMVGCTRSRASMFLNKFRRLGFIRYWGGKIHVHPSLVTALDRKVCEIEQRIDRQSSSGEGSMLLVNGGTASGTNSV